MVNVLVSDVVPLHERGTFVGLNNLAGAMGLVSGVVLGAAFAEKSTWRLYVLPLRFEHRADELQHFLHQHTDLSHRRITLILLFEATRS